MQLPDKSRRHVLFFLYQSGRHAFAQQPAANLSRLFVGSGQHCRFALREISKQVFHRWPYDTARSMCDYLHEAIGRPDRAAVVGLQSIRQLPDPGIGKRHNFGSAPIIVQQQMVRSFIRRQELSEML